MTSLLLKIGIIPQSTKSKNQKSGGNIGPPTFGYRFIVRRPFMPLINPKSFVGAPFEYARGAHVIGDICSAGYATLRAAALRSAAGCAKSPRTALGLSLAAPVVAASAGFFRSVVTQIVRFASILVGRFFDFAILSHNMYLKCSHEATHA